MKDIPKFQQQTLKRLVKVHETVSRVARAIDERSSQLATLTILPSSEVAELRHELVIQGQTLVHLKEDFDRFVQHSKVVETKKCQKQIQNSKPQNSTSKIDELQLSQALGIVSVIVYKDIFNLFQQFQQFVLELFRQFPQLRAIFVLYQQGILKGPALFLKDDIHFWDAQGRFHRLDFTYFRHFAVFEAFLVSQFQPLPAAAQKIRNGDYHLVELSGAGGTMEDVCARWEGTIKPRSRFAMTMVVRAGYSRLDGGCPRFPCKGKGSNKSAERFDICSLCGLEYEVNRLLLKQRNGQDLPVSHVSHTTSSPAEIISTSLSWDGRPSPHWSTMHPLDLVSPAMEDQLLRQLKRIRLLPNDQLPTHFKALGGKYSGTNAKYHVDPLTGITKFLDVLNHPSLTGSRSHYLISDYSIPEIDIFYFEVDITFSRASADFEASIQIGFQDNTRGRNTRIPPISYGRSKFADIEYITCIGCGVDFQAGEVLLTRDGRRMSMSSFKALDHVLTLVLILQ